MLQNVLSHFSQSLTDRSLVAEDLAVGRGPVVQWRRRRIIHHARRSFCGPRVFSAQRPCVAVVPVHVGASVSLVSIAEAEFVEAL